MSQINFGTLLNPLGVPGGPGKVYTMNDLKVLGGLGLAWPEHGVVMIGANVGISALLPNFTGAPITSVSTMSRPWIATNKAYSKYARGNYTHLNIAPNVSHTASAVSGGIDTSNKLWTFGQSSAALLRSTTNPEVPTQVGVDNWLRFSTTNTNSGSATAFSMALKSDGTLWCGGTNTNGQAGNNATSTTVAAMTQTGTDTNWADVWALGTYVFATKTNGTLWSWGDNTNYRTGLLTNTGNTLVPTQVGTSTDWLGCSITGTSSACLALKANGTIWSWGSNALGSTGQGTAVGSTFSPTQIGTDTDWVGIESVNNNGIFLKSNGYVYITGSVDLHPTSPANLLVPTLIIAGAYPSTRVKSMVSMARASFFYVTEDNGLYYYAGKAANSMTGNQELGTFVTQLPSNAKLHSAGAVTVAIVY